MAKDKSEAEQTEILASEISDKILKGEDIELDDYIIVGNLDLRQLCLGKGNCNISQRDRYQEGRYQERGLVIKIVVSRITLRNCRFKGELNLTYLNFVNPISFKGSHFERYVDFRGSRFKGYADFHRSHFERKASFTGSRFEGYAYFGGSHFEDDAIFIGSHFEGWAYFSGSHFGSGAEFPESRFEDVAKFMISNFEGGCRFNDSHFEKAVYFNGSHFKGDVIFRNSQFDNVISFDAALSGRKTLFRGLLILDNCKIHSMYIDAEFSNSYERQISLQYPDLNHIFVRWETIKDYIQYHGSAYLALIRNYNNLEWFEDADQCYYEYRKLAQSNKGDWYPANSNKMIDRLIRIMIASSIELFSYLKILVEDFIKFGQIYPFNRIYWFNWAKLIDHISWLFCGYGVKLERIILWIFASILIFAFNYKMFNIIVKTDDPVTSSTSLIDCLYFSTMVLTGLTPGSMHAFGSWMYLVAIERLLGYLFLGLFVVVLARKLIK